MRFGYVKGNSLTNLDPLGLSQIAVAGDNDKLGIQSGNFRFLTPGEKEIVNKHFNNNINLDEVQIYNKGYANGLLNNRVSAPNGNVYVGPKNNSLGWDEDYSNNRLRDQSVLIHEMTHVYQTQNGKGSLIDDAIVAKIQHPFSDKNMYTPDINFNSNGRVTSTWDDLNIEQQATVSEKVFLENNNPGYSAPQGYSEVFKTSGICP